MEDTMGKPVKGRSTEITAMLLRGGSGKHGDRRTKRNRDRSSQKRNAIRDAS